MKKKEIRIVALAATLLATNVLGTVSKPVQAAGSSTVMDGAVAGITVSINHFYKNTLDQLKNQPDTDNTVNEAVGSSLDYANIGIAKVNNYLNIRTKADKDSEVIGMLPKDGGCYIYSIDNNGWAKIKSGKITGYVSSEYLVTGQEVVELAKKVATKIATVNTVTVRLREEMNTDCTTLALIGKGEELDVIDDSNKDWVYVCLDSDKGYIKREYVDVKYQLKKATELEEDAVSASASTTSSIRSKMVAYAKQFIGGKYVYGGTSLKTGIDCSAFMMRIYEHFGYNISRTSRSQAAEGKEISASEIKPGDLVFYDKNGIISHVAMYIGNGKIIHASNRKSGIKISNMNYKKPYKICSFLNE